jgi:putative phosphoesterase
LSVLSLVLADTHIPRRAKGLPEALRPYLELADVILHAGDVMEPAVLDTLAGYATTHAVRGNLDPPESGLPETLELDLGGIRVAMIHDSGRKDGRHRRMSRRFPQARVVVFGHSHIPLLEDEDGLMLLNPGSPTDKRRQPEYTFAVLKADGEEVEARIVAL